MAIWDVPAGLSSAEKTINSYEQKTIIMDPSTKTIALRSIKDPLKLEVLRFVSLTTLNVELLTTQKYCTAMPGCSKGEILILIQFLKL